MSVSYTGYRIGKRAFRVDPAVCAIPIFTQPESTINDKDPLFIATKEEQQESKKRSRVEEPETSASRKLTLKFNTKGTGEARCVRFGPSERSLTPPTGTQSSVVHPALATQSLTIGAAIVPQATATLTPVSPHAVVAEGVPNAAGSEVHEADSPCTYELTDFKDVHVALATAKDLLASHEIKLVGEHEAERQKLQKENDQLRSDLDGSNKLVDELKKELETSKLESARFRKEKEGMAALVAVSTRQQFVSEARAADAEKALAHFRLRTKQTLDQALREVFKEDVDSRSPAPIAGTKR